MTQLYKRLSMKHLMLVALAFKVMGLLWVGAVLAADMDPIWLIPGFFLIISGITKAIAVQVWIRVARIGTDEHKPIKAL